MKELLFIGHFKDAAGYANAARGFLSILDKFLDKTKYNLKIFCLNFEKQDYSNEADKEIIQKYNLSTSDLLNYIDNKQYTLLMCCLPSFCAINTVELPLKKVLEHKNCIKSINSLFWEADKVPEPWLDIFKTGIYDQIIVSCEWNKEVFSRETDLPVSVVHSPVYDYYNLDEKNKNKKFTIFSMSQWQHRKGFDILLRAFYQEFFDHFDVELFIKTYRGETTTGIDEASQRKIIVDEISRYKQECLHYSKLPNCKVLLKTGFCSKQEIKNFYQNADVFCLPTRGEGFGLTIAQAALSGVPCIVPDLGGHLDYLDKQSVYLIKSSFEPAYNMPFHAYSSKEMNLVEPSLGDTRKQLRKAYEDWKSDEITEIGLKNKKYAIEYLSEQKIFNELCGVINEL